MNEVNYSVGHWYVLLASTTSYAFNYIYFWHHIADFDLLLRCAGKFLIKPLCQTSKHICLWWSSEGRKVSQILIIYMFQQKHFTKQWQFFHPSWGFFSFSSRHWESQVPSKEKSFNFCFWKFGLSEWEKLKKGDGDSCFSPRRASFSSRWGQSCFLAFRSSLYFYRLENKCDTTLSPFKNWRTKELFFC